MAEAAADDAAEPAAAPAEPTVFHVRIDGFQRPLTDKVLFAWLQATLGAPVEPHHLWLNKIKTHCYIDFPTRAQAQACIDAVTGAKVDDKHTAVLAADFTDVAAADADTSEEAKLKPGEWKAFRDAAKRGKSSSSSSSSSGSSSGDGSATGSRSAQKAGADAGGGLAKQVLGGAGILRRRGRGEGENGETAGGAGEGTSGGDGEEDGGGNGRGAAKRAKTDGGAGGAAEMLALDTLFRKTAAVPNLYWLPVSDEELMRRQVPAVQT